LVDGEDGELEPYLTDFGLCKLMELQEDTLSEGIPVGTLRWQSPERVDGGPLDLAVDVWAFGLTAVEVDRFPNPIDLI
jgi:serine/threonine protein kinase